MCGVSMCWLAQISIQSIRFHGGRYWIGCSHVCSLFELTENRVQFFAAVKTLCVGMCIDASALVDTRMLELQRKRRRVSARIVNVTQNTVFCLAAGFCKGHRPFWCAVEALIYSLCGCWMCTISVYLTVFYRQKETPWCAVRAGAHPRRGGYGCDQSYAEAENASIKD